MNYTIGICDDEEIYIDLIKTQIYNFFDNESKFDILTYHTAEEVINKASKLDILFLDIEMPEMSGIQLKKRLEKLNYNCYIIYITNHEDYMNEAFGKNVIAYITKSNLQKIKLILESIIIRENNNKCIRVGNINFKINDIVFIKADKGYVHIFTSFESFYFCIYLKELLYRIDSPNFMQVHRSYLVNFSYINTFNSKEIVLVDERKILLSRKYKAVFKQRYFKYLKEI